MCQVCVWVVDVVVVVKFGDVCGGVDCGVCWNLVVCFVMWVEIVQYMYVFVMCVGIVQVDGQFVDGG